MSSLKELSRLINIEDITAITTNTVALSIPETLKLMGDVDVESLNTDLTFWTKDQKVFVDGYGEWDSEVQFMRISLIPPKDLIEGIPESVTTVWEDPESGKRLPFKTEAYYDKLRKKEKAEDELKKENANKVIRDLNVQIEEDKNYFNNLPTVKDEPFTIIKGGLNNNCRYITLPKSFPYSKSSYGLLGNFYSEISEESCAAVDFSGIAVINNGDLEVVSRYLPSNIEENYTEEHIQALNKRNELYETSEENGKLVKIIGFAIESLDYRELGTLDEVAKKLKDELKKLNKM